MKLIITLIALSIPGIDLSPHIAPAWSDKPSKVVGMAGPQINWDLLNSYFLIQNIKLERVPHRDPMGRITYFNTLSFIVEAKTSLSVALFYGHCFDADEIEVGIMSPVSFNPDYSLL